MEVDAEEEALKAAIVDLLLKSEADPNKANEEGDTALHFICEQASSPVQSLMVTRLLEAGANPSKVSHSPPPCSLSSLLSLPYPPLSLSLIIKYEHHPTTI